MAELLRSFPGLLAAAILAAGATATATEAEKLGRPMQVTQVKEVGLEIWTELEPTWETRLETPPGMRPSFAVETPASTYPPAGMSFAVPGYVISPAELPTVVKSAVRQAALNYGLSDAEIKLIAQQSGESARRVRAQMEKRDLMDILRNQIIERKTVDLILSEAKFRDVPFEMEEVDTEAVEFSAIGGDEEEIPEAQPAPIEEKREPVIRG